MASETRSIEGSHTFGVDYVREGLVEITGVRYGAAQPIVLRPGERVILTRSDKLEVGEIRESLGQQSRGEQ